MRQGQHSRGTARSPFRGGPLAFAVAMFAVAGVSPAQSSDPNTRGQRTLPPPPQPAATQVPRTWSGRAALPSTQVGMPSGLAGLGGRWQPMGQGTTAAAPPATQAVVQPVKGIDSSNIIPIGYRDDPGRVFQEWRDLNSRLRTSPPEVKAATNAGNGRSSPPGLVFQHDPLNPNLTGDHSRFTAEQKYRAPTKRLISRRSTVINGIQVTYEFYYGRGETSSPYPIGPNQLLYGEWGSPDGLYEIYGNYNCTGRGVIGGNRSERYDPTLSANYDPQTLATAEEAAAQAPPVSLSQHEKAIAAFEGRHFAAAIRALRQELKENPGKHEAERTLGIAELMNGNLLEGVAVVSRAYLAEPSLADEAFTGTELGLRESDLRELSERAVVYANRAPTVASLVTAAVLLHGRDRVDAAVGMIDRAGKCGLNSDLAGMLTRAMKPPPTAAAFAPKVGRVSIAKGTTMPAPRAAATSEKTPTPEK